MILKNKKTIVVAGAFIAIILVIIAIDQVIVLRKAHSTFENYYAFRGCIQLLERTDTYGTCRTVSGATIKIVKYGNRWFLDGDGPGIW